jgi:hypothetical protein
VKGANAGSVADRPLHALSDAELVTESLPCASGAGCYTWLFALTLPLPVGLLWGARWALLSLMLGVLTCRVLSWLRERSPRMRRARRAEAEFARRFGAAALNDALEDARALLARDHDVDVVLCLYGRGLPHGDQHLVRVDLGRQEATLHVHQAAYLADLWRNPERTRQLRRAQQTLTSAAVHPLRAALDAVAQDHDGPAETSVLDGFPCTLVLLRRGQAPQRWDLNLGGIEPEHEAHAVVRLISRLFELERGAEGRSR